MNTNQFWTADTIKAVGGLWPLALIVFLILGLIVLVIFFRPQAQKLLDNLRNFTFKRGNTEIVVNQPPPVTQATADLGEAQQSASGLPKKAEVKRPVNETPAQPELELEPSSRLIYYMHSGELEKAERTFQELQSKEKDPEQRIRSEAHYLSMRFEKGDVSAEGKLQELEIRAKEFPSTLGVVKRARAQCYAFARNHSKAVKLFKDSADHCVTEEGKADSISGAAASLYEVGEKTEAIKLLKEWLCKVNEPKAKITIYRALGRLYLRENDLPSRAHALQRALSYGPNSKELTFDTAYACSQAGLPELAVLHYEKLVEMDEKYTYAQNNLGVAFGVLGAPTLAVSYYKKAIALGETLASANFANSLIDAGASEEAEKILKDAQGKDDAHENVNHGLVKLKGARKKDEDTRNKVIQLAKSQYAYLIDYADALFAAQLRANPWEGNWQDSQGNTIELKFDTVKNSIEIIWSEEVLYTYVEKVQGKFKFSGSSVGLTTRGDVTLWKQSYFEQVTGQKTAFEKWGAGFAYLTPNLDSLILFVQNSDTSDSKIIKFLKTPST
jgi:tetratricopeptide (TPR) repeat protein